MKWMVLLLLPLLTGCVFPADRVVTHAFVVITDEDVQVESIRVCLIHLGKPRVVDLARLNGTDRTRWEGQADLVEGYPLIVLPPIFLFYQPDADPITAFQLAAEYKDHPPTLRNVATADISYRKTKRSVIYECCGTAPKP